MLMPRHAKTLGTRTDTVPTRRDYSGLTAPGSDHLSTAPGRPRETGLCLMHTIYQAFFGLSMMSAMHDNSHGSMDIHAANFGVRRTTFDGDNITMLLP